MNLLTNFKLISVQTDQETSTVTIILTYPKIKVSNFWYFGDKTYFDDCIKILIEHLGTSVSASSLVILNNNIVNYVNEIISLKPVNTEPVVRKKRAKK